MNVSPVGFLRALAAVTTSFTRTSGPCLGRLTARFLCACLALSLAGPQTAGAFGILGVEREVDPPGWQITWSSTQGELYRLEATDDLEVGSWMPVALLEAAGEATTAFDATVLAEGERRFWRVVRWSAEGGIFVSPVAAYADLSQPLPQTVFSVRVWSDVGVEEVRFFSGRQLRGLAERVGNPLWELREVFDPDYPQPVALRAEARDALDRTGQTEEARFLLADPERFVPLDSSGRPMTGHFLRLRADGSLEPFEFRPDGRAAPERQTGLALRFPAGARMHFSEGAFRIESDRGLTVRRGWFDRAPVMVAPGVMHRIPTDGLRPADLAPVLGMDPVEPITLWSLGDVPTEWSGGALGMGGMQGLQTAPAWNAVLGAPPLPGPPQSVELRADPDNGESYYQVIYHGTYLLPGGLEFRIPRQSPWVFRLYHDWRIELTGETEIRLPNGGRLAGSVGWRNGTVTFSLSAHNLTLQTLGSLLELLPPDPAALVPGNANDSAMNLAAVAFEAYRQAYRNLAAGAVRIDSVDRERDLVPMPDPIETATASLTAWSWRLLGMATQPTGPLGSAATEAIARLTGHAAASGRAAYDLPEVLAWKQALARLHGALGTQGLGGDATALRADIETAAAELTQALRERLRTSDREELVALLAETARAWLDLIAAAEAADSTLPGLATEVLAEWLHEVGTLYFARLGVEPDEFDPVFNSVVLGLDRFTAAAALNAVLDLYALAQWLGQDQVAADLPVMEALHQLVTRMADLHELDLGQALQQNSFELAMIIARQRLELMALMQLLGLDQEFPDFFVDPVLSSRWDEIADHWLNDPSRPTRRDSLLGALRYLTRILAYVPDKAGQYSASVHDDLAGVLNAFLTEGRFNPALTPRDWLEWLEGGLLADRLGRRYFLPNLTNPGTGTDSRSPLQILVDGVIETSGGNPGSTADPQFAFLDQAAGLLLTEIQSLRLEIENPALTEATRLLRRQIRLAHLEALGRVLAGYQRVAVRLYTEASATPGTLAYAADLLLPGALQIHELAGSARFRPASGFLAGRFSGSLALPKFDARLTIPNASFDTRGNFQLAAYGQAGFPGGPQASQGRVVLRVPARRPLSLAVADDGTFALSGGADLALPSGHILSGYLSIDDPDYVFELAYGGALRFALMKEVTLFRPVFDPQQLPDLETLAALSRVFGSLGTGFEAFLNQLDDADLPSLADLDPGTPPEFNNPVSTIPLDAWDAWLTTFANDSVIPFLNAPIHESLTLLKGLLNSAREEFATARADLAPDLNRLRGLRDRLDRIARTRELLNEIAERSLAGDDDIIDLVAETQKAAAESIAFASEYLNSLPADVSLPHRLGAIEMVIQSVAVGQITGLEVQVDSAELAQGLRNGAAQLLADAGLNPSGQIVNPEQLESLSFRRLMVLGNAFLELAASEQLAGLDDSQPQNPVVYQHRAEQFYDLARARKHQEWLQARDTADLENLAVSVIWLLDFSEAEQSGFDLTPSEIATIDDAFHETLTALRSRYGALGGSPLEEKLAWEFIEAAQGYFEVENRVIWRETRELLGQTPETRVDLSNQADPTSGVSAVLRRLAGHWTLLESNGLLDPTRLATTQFSLRGWLQAYVNTLAQAAVTPDGSGIDVAYVEANFQNIFNALLAASDIIAFLEEYLPEEANLRQNWQATWQALHLEWIGVAQARQAWWYLSQYVQALADASQSFGAGVSTATQAAFRAAAAQALTNLQAVTDDFAELVASLDLEAFLFPLPGDLVLDRLFGRVEFNRITGFWRVAFGGALRFPDINLAFSLDRGELASNGDFALALRTSGPAPFGFDDSLQLDIANSFSLSGNLLARTLSSASANGTLIRQLPEGGQETYSVSLGYVYTPSPPPNQNQGEHRFNFNLDVGGDIEVFTEDLVLFRGGLGFALVLSADGVPTQGAFEVSAVVGILAKPGAVAPYTPDDFQLRLDGQASVEVNGEESVLTLSGLLFLPEGFQAATCGTPGMPNPAAGRPVVVIPATQPLAFTYRSPSHPQVPLRNTVAFSGSLALADLRFSLPGLDLLWIDVCTFNLVFGFDAATGKPTATLTDVAATINVPLPDGQQVRTGVQTANWSLNRLPQEGLIFLQTDLTLFNAGGFKLELLGIPEADLLGLPRTFIALDPGNPPGILPSFILNGSLRSSAGGWFTDQNGDSIVLTGLTENISLTVSLPPSGFPSLQEGHFQFNIGAVEFGCESSVPGQPCKLFFTDGIAVVDPRLKFTNPLRALRPTPAQPFEVEMDLAFEFVTGGPTITIEGKQFALIFDGSPDAPLVKLGSAEGCLDFSDAPGGLKMTSSFPLYVKKFCVALKNLTGDEGVPLFTDDPTRRPAFSADNLEFTLSAGVDFGDGSVNSILYGEVDDVVISFVNNEPVVSIDGIGIGVDFSVFFEEFPFKGKVYLSGFQSEDEFFLSGVLGANIKGNMVEAVAALNQTGPIGLCVGLAGAEVNIPIYAGFVLTGARGGIIRGTGFQDPCAFVTRYQINPQTGRTTAPPQPPPDGGNDSGNQPTNCEGYLATYDQLQAWRNQDERDQIALNAAQMEVVRRLVGQAGLDQDNALDLVENADLKQLDDLNAVVDEIVEQNQLSRIDLADLCAFDCPPASLGAMAQMHPEAFIEGSPYQGRAIWKFTSVDATTLNFFGINRDRVDSFVPQAFTWNPSTFIPEFAGSFAEEIRLTVERLVPRPPTDFSPLPTPDWALEFDDILTEVMNEFELGLYNTINCGLRSIVPDDLTRDDLVDLIWDHLREAAYAGIPYEDVTIRLEGSFSYTGVASFASVTGGILYTPGSSTMGVVGSINVFGIPFGYLQGFISSYDAYGNPQLIPALCGEIVAAIGPLEFGRGSFLWDCPDCFGRIVDTFDTLANALTAPYVYARMLEVAPEKAFPDATVPQHLLQLATEEEKIAFIAAVVNHPPTLNTGQVTSAFRQWFIDLANSIAQRIVQCGATQPKLFGFPLSGDNVYQSYASYFGPKDLANYDQDPSLLLANRMAFSPFQMAAQPLVMATGGFGAVASMFIPAVDQAVLFSVFEFPNLGTLIDEFLTLPLNEFVDHQFRRLIATSSNTFEYQLAPLGLELSRAGGRLLFPSYDYHPARPDGAVKPSPESRDLPSRRELLLAALRGEFEEEEPEGGGPRPPNQLADPNWRGTPEDIASLFAGTSFEPVFNASPTSQWPHLIDDYFPHGGMIGAAEFRVPRLLSQGLPPSYFTLINPASVEVAEWLQAVADFLAYLGATDPGGQLSFYLPAPNPPSFLAGQFPASPGDLLESLRAFDPLGELANLYPLDRAFFQGQWDVSLFGLPLVDGFIDLDPAVPIFRFEARVPANSWLDQLIGANSRLTAEMRLGEDSDLPIALLAAELQQALASLGNNPTPAQVNSLLNQITHALSRRLPRAALSYSEQLQIPPWLADFVRLPAGDGFDSSYELFAFTPQFDPDYNPADTTPYALARRHGGVGFRGDFYLGYSPLNLELLVSDASFLVLAGPNPFSTPRMVANLQEISGSLPFAGVNFDILGLFFDTQPGFNGTLASFAGQSLPPNLGPLIQFAAPGQPIAAQIQVRTPAQGQPSLPTASVFFDPVEVAFPVLGGATATLYGDAPGQPWGFSNQPGQPWTATLEIHGGQLSLLDPLALITGDPDPGVVLEIDSSNQSFFAQLGDSDGTGVVALRISIAGPGIVRAFPGQAHEAVFATPNTATCLVIQSNGRVYFDSGTRELDLAFGLAQITGRVEFGVEPEPATPVLAHSTPSPMTVNPGSTTAQTVSVANAAAGAGIMIVDAFLADPTHFTVIPTRQLIPAGESRVFQVRFTPQTAANRNTELILQSNATIPEVSIPLVGIVNTAPRYQATAGAVDFGLTPLGTIQGAGIVIVNPGTATLSLTGIATTGAGFNASASTLQVPAGQTRTLLLEFLPLQAGIVNGTLTFATNDPDHPSVNLPLTGNGENRFWIRQHRGGGLDTLTAIAMGADGRAIAGGLHGALLRGSEFGRLWQENPRLDSRDVGTLVARTTDAQSTEMHLAGRQGWVLFSANGGQSWLRVDTSTVAQPIHHWHGSTVRLTSGQVILVGEAEGRAHVAALGGSTVVSTTVFSDLPPLRDVAFGTERQGIAVGDNGTLLRLTTNDNGQSWMPELLALPDGVPATTTFRGIAVRLTGGNAVYVVVGDNGTLLRTTDSGHSWTSLRSGTAADLHAICWINPDRFYAFGNDGVILLGGRGGSVWTREFAQTTGHFRGATAIQHGLPSVGDELWAVTADGEIFHRQTRAVTGPVTVIATDNLTVPEAGIREPVIRELRIGNAGVGSMTATVNSSDPAFEILPASEFQLQSGEEQTVYIAFAGTSTANPAGTVISIDSSDLTWPGLELTMLVQARRNGTAEFEPLGYLMVPTQVDLGTVIVGEPVETRVAAANIGYAPLRLHGLEVRHAHLAITADVEPLFTTLAPFDERVLNLRLSASAPGRFSGTLELSSDAANSVALLEWTVNVVEVPDVVFIGTNRELPVQVDNNGDGVFTRFPASSGPRAFVVVDHPVAPGALEIQRGTVIRARVEPSVQIRGARWEFQRWNPGTTGDLEFVAGSSASQFTALYQLSPAPQSGPGPITPVNPVDCQAQNPGGVTAGPWLRISQAKLSFPWLADPATTEFAVEGSLFLSREHAYGSLRSAPVLLRVPDHTSYGPLAGIELLRITPAGWAFDLDVRESQFHLRAANPGLRVLGHSLQPSTDLAFQVALGDPAARTMSLHVGTGDELPLIPGLVALAPGSVQFESSLLPNALDLAFSIDGGLRALANPNDPAQWLINRPYTFEVRPNLPLPGIGFTGNISLLNLGAVHVRANASTTLTLNRQDQDFQLVLNNLLLQFFGSDDHLVATSTFTPAGAFSLETSLPAAGIRTGPVRLRPHGSTSAARRIAVEANPFAGRFAVDFPRIWIDSLADLWNPDTIATPDRFSFDSANLTLRLPLAIPAVQGFTVNTKTQVDANNYLEFRRRPNTGSTLRVRAQRDYLLGNLKLKLDATDAGALSGTIAGRLNAAAPPPLHHVNRTVSLAYQLQAGVPVCSLNRHFLGIEFSLGVTPATAGAANGIACIVATGTCFP
jgi:photosystem II stability/assembly factor-like uncharacterized protein